METLEAIKLKYGKHSEEQIFGELARLLSEIENLKTMLFCSGRERAYKGPVGLALMFNECEFSSEVEEADDECDAPEEEDTSKPSTPKKRGKRKALPAHLLRIRREIDLPEGDKICPIHNQPSVKIGEEITEKLVIIPAKVHVDQVVTFKYSRPCCGDFHAAKRDPDPIPKSFASPSLLAYIATAKFVDGLPLYRQERIFDRLSIDLNRATMSRWMLKMADLAKPLGQLMHEDLLQSPVIHADETEVQVISEANRSAQAKSYMWCAARRGDEPIVLFNYEQSRSKKAALNLLGTYSGTIICDGYKVYDSLGPTLNCKLAGCMAHARRKFWQAEKIAKKEAKKSGEILASVALKFIKDLSRIEEKIKLKPPSEILKTRQEESVPILEKFYRRLEKNQSIVLPSSPTGRAISYTMLQWKKLIVFTEDPLVLMDNNFMEAHIRPFVIGRNAWIFSYSPAGAEASALLYSLVETAKANGIDPHDYLNLIFKELPKSSTLDRLEILLPYKAKANFSLKPYQISK